MIILCYAAVYPRMTDPPKNPAPFNPVLYVVALVPSFVGYRVAEGMALGAGMSRWPSIGLGSLGGIVGACIGGAIIYLIVRRKNPSVT